MLILVGFGYPGWRSANSRLVAVGVVEPKWKH